MPRYEFFFDVISQSSPDVVIVSLDSDQSKALQLIGQLTQVSPDLPILAVSAKGDGQAILQALRSGAKEFLTAPVVIEDLLKALQRLRHVGSRFGDRADLGERQKRDGFANSASRGRARFAGRHWLHQHRRQPRRHAAQQADQSAALVDLDLALGDADVALDLMADYTLADVALNVERLDMQFLRRSLSKHSCGLSLLPHPVQMEDISLIREESLQRVIGLLRASFTHLVLDLSKSFSATDVAALHTADVILLVAQLELSSLRNVVRIVQTLGNDETLSEKVKIVLNRVGPECDIPLKKAQETIGKPDLLAAARGYETDDGVAKSRDAAAAARPEEQVATKFRGPGSRADGRGNRGAGQRKGGAVGYVCTTMKLFAICQPRAQASGLVSPARLRSRLVITDY